jgi:iron(III) transport system substrate-binding protein
VIRTFSAILCLGAAVAVSALAFTGCGGSDDTADSAHPLEDVLAAVDGMSGAKRTAELERLAAAEGGELTLYTSTDRMRDVTDAFEDEHDVGVAIYEASSEGIVQRMIEEKAAGYRGSDAVEMSTPNLVPLVDEGILAQYKSPKLAGLVPESLGESWIADKLNTFVVAWNTDRVPKGQEPHSYEDLADPRWKGKLALEKDDGDWYKELWEHLVETGKTPNEADRIFEGIARNATFVDGHTLMTELVASGEFDITPDAYLHAVEELRGEGAPLAWEPAVKPLISRPDGIAVVRDAKHPAAALLFVDFLLDQGQEIFADAGLTVTRKDLGVPESIPQIAMDVPDYVANAEKWTQRYEDLVRLGKLAPDTG